MSIIVIPVQAQDLPVIHVIFVTGRVGTNACPVLTRIAKCVIRIIQNALTVDKGGESPVPTLAKGVLTHSVGSAPATIIPVLLALMVTEQITGIVYLVLILIAKYAQPTQDLVPDAIMAMESRTITAWLVSITTV